MALSVRIPETSSLVTTPWSSPLHIYSRLGHMAGFRKRGHKQTGEETWKRWYNAPSLLLLLEPSYHVRSLTAQPTARVLNRHTSKVISHHPVWPREDHSHVGSLQTSRMAQRSPLAQLRCQSHCHEQIKCCFKPQSFQGDFLCSN